MIFVEPKKAIQINSIILILVGLFSYFVKSSPTALIPVIFGLFIGACYFVYDKNNKLVAHVCLLLMLLIFGSLFMPLMARLNFDDLSGIVRIAFMQLVTAYSITCFIKNFIEARRK